MTAGYDAFAREIVASGVLTDPWIDGEPRFQEDPVVISESEAATFAGIGREVAEVYEEAMRIVADDPDLLGEFYGLAPVQRAMFEAFPRLWHGIARADVFRTADGFAVAELNCDTPTGEAEAWVLGRIAGKSRPDLMDPNEDLPDHLVDMVDRFRIAMVHPGAPRTVGLVYPTEFTEDLSLVRLYRGWLEARGWSVTLGSPYNLASSEEDPTVHVFDTPVSVLLRHYKTDWWAERASAWDDETIEDSAPLSGPLACILRGQAERRTAIVNPLGAIVAQNKRTMALLWEHLHRFPVLAQQQIGRLFPYTARLESLHPELLKAQREEWVLKSDYGAEGEEVLLGRLTDPETWEKSLLHARPGRWVAQRYFEAEKDARGRVTNYGVFVAAGEPAGLYARIQEGPTDATALSAPILIRPD